MGDNFCIESWENPVPFFFIWQRMAKSGGQMAEKNVHLPNTAFCGQYLAFIPMLQTIIGTVYLSNKS